MRVDAPGRPPFARVLVVAGLLAACEREAETPVPEVRPVRAIEVTPRRVSEPVNLTGRIEAEDEVALPFRIRGRVLERPVATGQRLEPGQLVARLEPQNETNALRTAEANLAAAQGQLDEARSEYGRQRRLEERGWTARAVYERARRALQTAQSRLDAAEAQLRLARDQLAFTEFFADAQGVVVAVLAEPGEVVAAGQPLVRLAREGDRDAVFDLPAAIIRSAPPEPTISVELADARSIRTRRRVREVSPEADPITRTFEVGVGLLDPPAEMRLGATVIGRMETEASEVLEIPASALFRHDGRPSGWSIRRPLRWRSVRSRTPGSIRRPWRFPRASSRARSWSPPASRPSIRARRCGSPEPHRERLRPLRLDAAQPLVVACLMLLAVAAGVVAVLEPGHNEDPAFTIETVVVRAAWPGATLEETIDQVTERIEREIQELDGLDVVRSFTRAGLTTVFIDLEGAVPSADVPKAWQRVRNHVTDIWPRLPRGVLGPFFDDRFGDVFGIICGFTADGFSHRELRDRVEDIRDQLRHVPEVSEIEILGAQDELVFLQASMRRLASLQLDRQALLAAIAQQNLVRPAGIVETGDERIALRVTRAFGDERDILDITFTAAGRRLRIGDIAEVRRGLADPPQPIFRVGGEPAIGLAIAMREGGDIRARSDNLAKAMARITGELPVGIAPHLVADQPQVVEEAIADFMTSLWQAVAIILAMSFVSLGVRPGLVVGFAIPLTLAIVFAVMLAVGIDMQRISLGALIIALALLVDDAMTTTDATVTRPAAGGSSEKGATGAFGAFAEAMPAGTFAAIAGFVSIGFAASAAGEYTFTLFAVVAIALVVSWFVAVLFTPLLSTLLLKPPKSGAAGGPDALTRLCRGLLALALKARWLMVASLSPLSSPRSGSSASCRANSSRPPTGRSS